MPPIFLARHGQSEWNKKGKIQGICESPLTDLGRAQARAVGERLVAEFTGLNIEVRHSPMGRARETAQIICQCLDWPIDSIIQDDRLRDFNVGKLAGYPGWDAVQKDFPELARFRLEDPMRFHPPEGESGADVMQRASSFLQFCESREIPILVVGHGVINKFIRAQRRGITGADIIAQGEAQNVVFRLDGTTESEIIANEVPIE